MNCQLLFVYGTLRQGFARHPMLERLGAAFEGKGRLQGLLVDLGDYPGALRGDNPRAHGGARPSMRLPSTELREAERSRGLEAAHATSLRGPSESRGASLRNGSRGASRPCILGEVYRLRNLARALRVLDVLEGYRPEHPEQSLFLREQVTVCLASGREVPAWVYWLNRARGPLHPILSGDYARR